MSTVWELSFFLENSSDRVFPQPLNALFRFQVRLDLYLELLPLE